MIRINLLATERKAAKKKVASAPGVFQLYLFLGLFGGGALLLCAAGYWLKESTLKELDAQIAVAQKRQSDLTAIKKQVEEFQAKDKLLTDKVNLIQSLKAEQANGVHLLDEISKALPDFVWLQSLDQAGNTLKFTGQSNSLGSVADFISNLQQTGWFPRVELDNSTEANNVVTFQLTAAFENPEVAAAKAAAAAAAAQAAPPAAQKKS